MRNPSHPFLLNELEKKVKVKSLSHVCLFATLWSVALQALPAMGFSRQKYWSGLPFPSPGDLLTQGLNLGHLHCRQTIYCLSVNGPGIELESPALAGGVLSAPPGKS